MNTEEQPALFQVTDQFGRIWTIEWEESPPAVEDLPEPIIAHRRPDECCRLPTAPAD